MKSIFPAHKPLSGEVRVPGDKSIGHRALMLGALARGGLIIRSLPPGLDVRSTRSCLEALGARVTHSKDEILIEGNTAHSPLRAPGRALDCGNSGTTMRLLAGMLSGWGFDSVLTGDSSLSARPMGRVAVPLREMGAEISLSAGDTAPIRLRGKKPLKALRHKLHVPSAQVKSALLLAALSGEGESVVEDPFSTRDHTERMLAWMKARISVERETIRLNPGDLEGGRTLTVPADPSSAAFFLAAAVLVEGSELTLPGVCVNPTRMGFVHVLREMGAQVAEVGAREEGGEPVADLRASFGGLRAVRVAAERIPSLVDEVPLLAVVASQAEGETRLMGLAELRHKESDRLSTTLAALHAMGVKARTEGEDLLIEGPCRLRGAAIETRADHRIAMAFAVAALAAQGETALSDAECAAISYPGFFLDLERCAGQ
ncbi:MAG: 3-phosphoshikimate 1-carboxyvinyltransferase [Elusimicrobiota bacterium]